MHLFETHLPVTDTRISEAFYREVVGLSFAHRDPARDIAFLWAGEKQKGMIGLWGASTGYGRQNGVLTPCHLAFADSFEELQLVIGKLIERRIETRWFEGNLTR
jgi:predicted enzyme related to lactoylglutathione lyase